MGLSSRAHTNGDPHMATKKTTTNAPRATRSEETADGFTEEERAAMKERAKEVRAGKRGGGAAKADGTTEVLAKIAEMAEPDRSIAERVHALVMGAAPELSPRTWYGMPAYAKDGKVLCFFQNAGKFKARYSTLGFDDSAKLDDGAMWPTSYAVMTLTPAVEREITALVRKAVG
jgi:uncharacterized protein YdhG (YjbR/CyaY superfamily)